MNLCIIAEVQIESQFKTYPDDDNPIMRTKKAPTFGSQPEVQSMVVE